MLNQESNKFSLFYTFSFLLLICFGIGLLGYQLFQDRGLWGDESFIACNILFKSYADFLGTLAYNQIAPLFFLSLEKFIISILGIADLNFRILPFLATLASIPLLGLISQFLFKKTYYVGFAISLLCLSPCVIYYSSEIKPYIIELFFTCLLIYLALVKNNRGFALMIAGCIAIFTANASILILFSISLLLIYEYFTKPNRSTFNTLLCLGGWGLSVLIFYVFFVHNNPTEASMDHWWMQHGGFLLSPFYPNVKEIFYRILYIFSSSNGFIYQDYISYANPLTYGMLYFGGLLLVGSFSIIKNKKINLIFYCLLPIIVHLVLNVFQLYPVEQRINLYQFPLLIILMLVGQKQVVDWLNPNWKWSIKLLPILFLGCIAFFMKNEFPKSRDNTKLALNYLLEAQTKNPTATIHLISYESMTKYYATQAKYTQLIEKAEKNQMRSSSIDIGATKGTHWFFMAHETKEKMLKNLKSEFDIKESIEELNLYRVEMD